MSDWAELRLDELGEVERGRSRHRPRNDPSLYGDAMPFFQTGDVKAGVLHLRTPQQWYSELGVAQSRVWEPGVACITIAANIADTAVLGVRGCFPDSVLGFTPSVQSADAYFVKYLLDAHRSRLGDAARGTTQDNLSLEKLLSFKFPMPGPNDRSVIASTLRAFDDLIENNRRRVEVLEEMARAIYRDWFVKFRYPGHEAVPLVDSALGPIPTGWLLKPLSSIATVNGSSRKPSADEVIRYLDISALSEREIGELDPIVGAEAPGRARRVLEPGDTVWATVRPNRRAHALVVEPGDDWIASTGLAVLTPKAVSSAYLFETTSTPAFSDWLVGRATGSAYPAVRANDFEQAVVLVPESSVDAAFAAEVTPMHELSWKLRAESSRLAQLRDLLLPKLVTGQIDVSALELDASVEDRVA